MIAGSPATTIDGKPVARVGDKVTCPQRGHGGTTVIVTGDPTCIVDGQPVARHGDKTACGATLISSQARTSVDAGGGGGGGRSTASGSTAGGASQNATGPSAAGGVADSTPATQAAASDEPKPFDEQFIVRDKDGDPMAGIYYTIRHANGKLVHGETGSDGKTVRVTTEATEMLEVFIGHIEEQA